MMVDVIFIQSWHGEIVNGQLEQFVQHLRDTPHNPVPVWVFMDQNTLDNDQYVDTVDRLSKLHDIQFEFVDDTKHGNAQTTVFYHMLRSKQTMYPRMLLLESDCRLKPNFDQPINHDIQGLANDWWVYGSTYYGVGGGDTETDNNQLRRNHMNGVAVYNRARQDMLHFCEQVYVTQRGVDSSDAFDWLFAKHYFSSEHTDKNLLYDSPYIINLSPTWDTNTQSITRKPQAVIIHQKMATNS